MYTRQLRRQIPRILSYKPIPLPSPAHLFSIKLLQKQISSIPKPRFHSTTVSSPRKMAKYLKGPASVNFSQNGTNQPPVDVAGIVKDVIDQVRLDGDAAVRRYSEKFDKWTPKSFRLSQEEIDACIAKCPEQTIKDIKEVQDNVRKFAEAQKACLKDFEVEIRPGVHLGHKNVPIQYVGA